MREEFRTIRENLEKRRRAILAKVSETRPSQSAEDITRGDSLDIASSSRDREITFMLKSRELDELRAVEDAIERIDADDYGICANCEDPIEIKRLEAIPWARFAVRRDALLLNSDARAVGSDAPGRHGRLLAVAAWSPSPSWSADKPLPASCR
jgi:DnaK suppressor protein